MQKKAGLWLAPAAWIVFSVAPSAYGYIDPGTGSYVLQTLLAVLFAAAYALKIYWRHVNGFFRSKFGRKHPDENDDKLEK
jgi:hypothetical protein